MNLKIDGVNIQEVSMIKYFGVTFDSNLTWKNHVDNLINLFIPRNMAFIL